MDDYMGGDEDDENPDSEVKNEAKAKLDDLDEAA